MRIIKSFRALNGFGNETTFGSHLTDSPDGSHLQLLTRAGVLARMSHEAFNDAVKRVDALEESPITLKSSIGDTIVGGRHLHRGDFEIRDEGSLWLVPEREKSEEILLFVEWTEWMTDGRSLTFESGATNLAHVEDVMWKSHWNAIALQPGSSVTQVTYGRRKVEGSEPTFWHPRRETSWTTVTLGQRNLAALSSDGLELTL